MDVRGVELNQNLPIGNVLDPFGIVLDLMSLFSSYYHCYFERSIIVCCNEGGTDRHL